MSFRSLCNSSETEILEHFSRDSLKRHLSINEREILALVYNLCTSEYEKLDFESMLDALSVLEEALSSDENEFSREAFLAAFQLSYQIAKFAFPPALFLFERWLSILETEFIPFNRETIAREIKDLAEIINKIKE